MPIDRPLQATQETVRMPLYDYDGNSTYRTGAAVIGPGNDQAYFNMIPKKLKNAQTGETVVTLEKRQGLDLVHDIDAKGGQAGLIASRAILGMSQLDDVLVGAFYRYNGGTKTIEIYQMRPSANTVTVIGTISTVAGPPAVTVSENTDVFLSEIKIGNVPGVAVVITNVSGASGTSAGYYALSSAGVFGAATLTKISDADFPTNQATYVHIVGPMVQMNQITYAMASDGRVYNSTTDTIGTWSALGFLEAEAYPDKGIGLVRYKHHIVAFNQGSIEFFNDIGNDPTTGSPLERTEQAFIKFGALYASSVVNIDDTLYWLASSNAGTIGVWKLDQYTPVEIATPEVLSDLSNANGTKNKYPLQQMIMNGTTHLVISGSRCILNGPYNWFNSLTTVTNEPTWAALDFAAGYLCYNIKDQMWWHMQVEDATGGAMNLYSAQLPSNNAVKDTYTSYIIFGNYDSQGPLSGSIEFTLYKVVAVGYGVWQDYSVDDNAYRYYPFAYQTNVQHFGTEKRKFLHRLKIIEDKPNFTTDTNPNHIKLLLSRTGFSVAESAIIYRTTALQAYASGVKRIYFHNLGAFRSLQYAILGKTKNPFSFMFTELDISQGTS